MGGDFTPQIWGVKMPPPKFGGYGLTGNASCDAKLVYLRMTGLTCLDCSAFLLDILGSHGWHSKESRTSSVLRLTDKLPFTKRLLQNGYCDVSLCALLRTKLGTPNHAPAQLSLHPERAPELYSGISQLPWRLDQNDYNSMS